jgi:hypothetical protein
VDEISQAERVARLREILGICRELEKVERAETLRPDPRHSNRRIAPLTPNP